MSSAAISRPGSEQELCELVAQAASAGQALEIRGGGTRPVGNPVEVSRIIATTKLSGISLYEPGALTLVAGAGTPLSEIRAALAAEDQMLPFEPPDWGGLLDAAPADGSTIGGVVATGAAGPRQLRAGGVRDSLIGVRFVTGEGIAVTNGGRVMKNVTGYDLVKLMAGSHGTLGIMTELSFKLLPAPEAAASIVIDGLDDRSAIAVLSAARRSPYEVSGAAHAQRGPQGAPMTLVRIEGLEASVTYRAQKLADLLAAVPGISATPRLERDGGRIAADWKWLRDVEAFHGRAGAVWRLAMRADRAPGVIARISAERECEAVYDCAGGLAWVLTPDSGDAGAALIRQVVSAAGGHALLMRAGEPTRHEMDAFQQDHERVEEISAGLRNRFDPASILNPGRMRRARTEVAA